MRVFIKRVWRASSSLSYSIAHCGNCRKQHGSKYFISDDTSAQYHGYGLDHHSSRNREKVFWAWVSGVRHILYYLRPPMMVNLIWGIGPPVVGQRQIVLNVGSVQHDALLLLSPGHSSCPLRSSLGALLRLRRRRLISSRSCPVMTQRRSSLQTRKCSREQLSRLIYISSPSLACSVCPLCHSTHLLL